MADVPPSVVAPVVMMLAARATWGAGLLLASIARSCHIPFRLDVVVPTVVASMVVTFAAQAGRVDVVSIAACCDWPVRPGVFALAMVALMTVMLAAARGGGAVELNARSGVVGGSVTVKHDELDSGLLAAVASHHAHALAQTATGTPCESSGDPPVDPGPEGDLARQDLALLVANARICSEMNQVGKLAVWMVVRPSLQEIYYRISELLLSWCKGVARQGREECFGATARNCFWRTWVVARQPARYSRCLVWRRHEGVTLWHPRSSWWRPMAVRWRQGLPRRAPWAREASRWAWEAPRRRHTRWWTSWWRHKGRAFATVLAAAWRPTVWAAPRIRGCWRPSIQLSIRRFFGTAALTLWRWIQLRLAC